MEQSAQVVAAEEGVILEARPQAVRSERAIRRAQRVRWDRFGEGTADGVMPMGMAMLKLLLGPVPNLFMILSAKSC